MNSSKPWHSNPYECLEQKEFLSIIFGKSNLNERQIEILHLKFVDNKNYREIGLIFKITGVRVGQLYNKIISKFRMINDELSQ